MSMSISSHSRKSFSHEITEHGDGYFYSGFSADTFQRKPGLYLEGDIKILKTLDLDSGGMCCQFSENGDKLAVGLSNGDIKIYQASSGMCIYHLSDNDTRAKRLPVTSINFLPTDYLSHADSLIATYASGLVKLWHVSTSTALQTHRESCQLLSSSLSSTSLNFATAGTSEEIYVYDVTTGKRINVCSASTNLLVMDGHRSRILAVKYHPIDENVFLSGGWDDTIQFWDQREQRATRNIFGPHICGDGIDIDDAKGRILSASWRKHDVMQVWDYKMGTKIKTIPNDFSYNSLLYCGQWLGKDRVVCGGSDNNMVRIIDRTTLATSGMICNLPGGVYSVDHDRQRLANQKTSNGDVTLIAAVAGKHLYFISNAVVPKKDEVLSS